jgi:hypothetical protein
MTSVMTLPRPASYPPEKMLTGPPLLVFRTNCGSAYILPLGFIGPVASGLKPLTKKGLSFRLWLIKGSSAFFFA